MKYKSTFERFSWSFSWRVFSIIFAIFDDCWACALAAAFNKTGAGWIGAKNLCETLGLTGDWPVTDETTWYRHLINDSLSRIAGQRKAVAQ